jgi:hypothetical protein
MVQHRGSPRQDFTLVPVWRNAHSGATPNPGNTAVSLSSFRNLPHYSGRSFPLGGGFELMLKDLSIS